MVVVKFLMPGAAAGVDGQHLDVDMADLFLMCLSPSVCPKVFWKLLIKADLFLMCLSPSVCPKVFWKLLIKADLFLMCLSPSVCPKVFWKLLIHTTLNMFNNMLKLRT